MTSTKTTFSAVTLAALLVATGAGASQAADPSSELTMKPLHGISFGVGSDHAVGYFVSENGQCKLVLTLAGEPHWDDVPSHTATRFEAEVSAGKATQFNLSEGTALEFACQPGAQAMSVKTVEQVATGSVR